MLGFEQVVTDPRRTLCQRAFAWYRLERHWASLRWYDTRGINPASLERRAGGVFAALEKSKTSGPGRKVKVLPVYVSDRAWDKAGLDSWCAALSVAEPEWNFLGRWSVKGTAGLYVRTACRVVENLQKMSAAHAQVACV